MRSFVAVKVPPFDGLVRLLGLLGSIPGVKAVEPHNVHVTLKFLGDVDEEVMDEVVKGLSSKEFAGPFEASLKGVGTFPGSGRPRVVWVGFEEGEDELSGLWKAVELATPFIPGDKRGFTPHVTVSRIKRGCDFGRVIKVVREFRDLQFGSFTVDRVTLFKSTLTPKGPVYEPLREFYLR